MESTLEKEFEYYRTHQSEFVGTHNGKFIVIRDQKVIGVYSDQLSAINETKKVHKLGTFLVQKVEPGNSGYTQTFHSRVAFS